MRYCAECREHPVRNQTLTCSDACEQVRAGHLVTLQGAIATKEALLKRDGITPEGVILCEGFIRMVSLRIASLEGRIPFTSKRRKTVRQEEHYIATGKWGPR